MSPPQLVHQPLVLPRLVHLRFYLIVVVTIAITALCWWRWPPDGGFESASLAIASLCTTLCIPSTLLLINAHIQAWERPVLQLCVVRILLMVPIYAVDAWLGLMQRGSDSARDLIDTARECYEAFVIYNFVLYLVAYFGSEHEIVTMLQQRKHAPEHIPPMHWCLPKWRKGERYLAVCKRGALQYVVVRLVTSLLAISPLYLPVSPHISLYLPAQVRLVTSLLACFCKLFDTAGVLPPNTLRSP